MNNVARQNNHKPLSLWTVYGICLLISTAFFLAMGFNSPIFQFNADCDFNWFMSVGNAMVAGKIPYRDLFEQKGPITYFVFAFCCLFKNPRIAILILEIISMSLFFFFAYRICRKRLNTFYSIIAIPLLAFAVFTSWTRVRSAASVEEFTLPIHTYFFLCWLEFLLEKKHWTWGRSLCLGLCFGIILWVKFTLFYFMLVPMIIWLAISIRRRQYKTLLINIGCIVSGVIAITIPVFIYYIIHNALNDLFYVYFYVNLTAYGTNSILDILFSFGTFFCIGPVILVLILWGVIAFSKRHWSERTGWLLLIAFLVNVALLIYSCKKFAYYYTELFPYGILGLTEILYWFNHKFSLNKYCKLLPVGIAVLCFVLAIPCSIYTYEWGRDRKEYAPLAIADTIHNYEINNNQTTTLWCYKFSDFGFYNATNKIPNNYFFAQNVFTEERFPRIYKEFNEYITNQTSDFVITELATWETEKDFLSQYYKPFTDEISDCTYHYRHAHYFYYRHFDFVLLIKK